MNSLLEEAHHLHREGKLREAVSRYEHLLEDNADLHDARILYMYALTQLGQFQKALSVLSGVPESLYTSDLFNAASICHEQLGQLDLASQCLKNAVENNVRADLLNRLAKIYIRQNKFTPALEVAG